MHVHSLKHASTEKQKLFPHLGNTETKFYQKWVVIQLQKIKKNESEKEIYFSN
jgi:hypothetical protein